MPSLRRRLIGVARGQRRHRDQLRDVRRELEDRVVAWRHGGGGRERPGVAAAGTVKSCGGTLASAVFMNACQTGAAMVAPHPGACGAGRSPRWRVGSGEAYPVHTPVTSWGV